MVFLTILTYDGEIHLLTYLLVFITYNLVLEKNTQLIMLFSITEKIREALDNNNFACGIFIDLQKAFDTVNHDILLQKLNHYGIRGVANAWFKSYLSNRTQFVSINGFVSNTNNIHVGVPQGSVLGPLLFLIYINDLNAAINYSTVHHFADDTNLLITGKSLKSIKKRANIDLKLLYNWLKANKISLNSSKTEAILFRHPNKAINYDLKLKIDGKKIYLNNTVKYLGVYLDQHLNWKCHIPAHKITGGQRSLTARNVCLTADIVSLTVSMTVSVFLAIPPSLQTSSGIFLISF